MNLYFQNHRQNLVAAVMVAITAGNLSAAPQDLIAITNPKRDRIVPSMSPITVAPGVKSPSAGRATNEQLDGTWLCVEATRQGKTVDSFVGVRAVVQGRNLTWIYPRADGNDLRHASRFSVDNTRSPGHFDWHLKDSPQTVRRRLYKIENGMLHWATNQSTIRPRSFDDAEWIFRCRRTGSPSRDSALRTRFTSPSVSDSVKWGTVSDPDNDCDVSETRGKITMHVPVGIHSMWCGMRKPEQRFNAPRVMKSVTGDFVAKVRMSANWKIEGVHTRDAGLLIWDSQNQYLKHDRCQFTHSKTKRLTHFTTPQYDLNFKRTNDAKMSDKSGFFGSDTTWLLMQRKGQVVYTWISNDGKDWQHTASIKTELPKNVQVGIFAGNRSPNGEFTVVFDNLVVDER